MNFPNIIKDIVVSNRDTLLSKFKNDTRYTDSINAIKTWIDEKKQGLRIREAILEPLLENPDILGNIESVTFDNWDSDRNSEFVSEVDRDVFDRVHQGITAAISANGEIFHDKSPVPGFTITDGFGWPYAFRYCHRNIIDTDGLVREVEGYSFVTDPHDYHDLFIYTNGTTTKVNALCKTLGYYRSGGTQHGFYSYYDALDEIIDLLEANVPELTIAGKLSALTGMNGYPIADMIQYLCSRYNVSPVANNLTNLNLIADTIFRSHQQPDYGKITYIGDILRDQAVNATIIDILGEVTDGLFANKIADTLSLLRDQYNDAKGTIKDMIHAISQAFNSGGFYGVISYLVSIIKGEASIKNEGETLVFTDNTTLAPQEYIGGIILTVLGFVGQVVGAVVFVFSKVAGALLTALSNILLAIPKAISYDYETAAVAAVNDGEGFVFSNAPMALMQVTKSVDLYNENSVFTQIYNIINEAQSPVYCQVPGGMLLIGKDSADFSIRMEFHPSSVWTDLRPLRSKFPVKRVYQQGSTRSKSYTIDMSYGLLNPSVMMDLWAECYSSEKSYMCQNGDLGVLTAPYGDAAQLQTTIINTSIFLMWLFMANASKTPNMLTLSRIFACPYADNDGRLEWATFSLNPRYFMSIFCQALDRANSVIPGDMLVLPLEAMSTEEHHDDLALWNWTDFIDNWFGASAPARVGGFSMSLYQVPDVNTGYLEPSAVASTVFVDMVGGITYIDNTSGDIMYGQASTVPREYKFYYTPPKYNSKTFLTRVIISVFIVAAIATVAAITAVKVKKWVKAKRAKLNASVAKSWEAYEDAVAPYNPDDDDDDPSYHTPEAQAAAYKTYFRTAKKNNRWQIILGGTKYSTAGYWDADDSGADTEVPGSSIFQMAGESSLDTVSSPTDVSVTLQTLYNLIAGRSPLTDTPIRSGRHHR